MRVTRGIIRASTKKSASAPAATCSIPLFSPRAPALFNSDGTPASFDTRSDNKGPKPEAAVIGKVFGRTYAFIGLERAGGIMVYDISNPFDPFFVDYVNTSPIDIAPEGLVFIEDESPNGKGVARGLA